MLSFSCSKWDLQLWHVGTSSLTRDQTQAPALVAWSLSHWTTGKSLCCYYSLDFSILTWTCMVCRGSIHFTSENGCDRATVTFTSRREPLLRTGLGLISVYCLFCFLQPQTPSSSFSPILLNHRSVLYVCESLFIDKLICALF